MAKEGERMGSFELVRENRARIQRGELEVPKSSEIEVVLLRPLSSMFFVEGFRKESVCSSNLNREESQKSVNEVTIFTE